MYHIVNLNIIKIFCHKLHPILQHYMMVFPFQWPMEALSEIARDLGLLLVQIEGWIVICRSTFDTYIEGEPFHSMQLYANPAIKKYLLRIWGRTIISGYLSGHGV